MDFKRVKKIMIKIFSIKENKLAQMIHGQIGKNFHIFSKGRETRVAQWVKALHSGSETCWFKLNWVFSYA